GASDAPATPGVVVIAISSTTPCQDSALFCLRTGWPQDITSQEKEKQSERPGRIRLLSRYDLDCGHRSPQFLGVVFARSTQYLIGCPRLPQLCLSASRQCAWRFAPLPAGRAK